MNEPGKRIVIYGATSTIAEETARLFAAEGASLFLIARNSEKLKALQSDYLVRGAKQVEYLLADLSDVLQHREILEKAIALLGEIDLILIAYGTLSDQERGQKDVDYALGEFNTNCTSILSILTHAANYFEARRSGTIAVISSVAGDRGRQSNYLYGSAKGALDIFLQGLRNRMFRHGVRVLTIKPGFVDTAMTAALKKNFLFVKAPVVASGIKRAVERGKDVVYLPWFWWFIMFIIRIIPETLFKRLRL